MDELCTSIVGHELDDSPCSLLATPDGWRRVFFPSPRAGGGSGDDAGAAAAAAAAAAPSSGVSCCKYCNLTDYCGIVQPDWLRRGKSVYLGNATIGGRVCAHWQKQGGESNNWYAEVGTDLPCEYWEGCVGWMTDCCRTLPPPRGRVFLRAAAAAGPHLSAAPARPFHPPAPFRRRRRLSRRSYPELPSSNYWRFNNPAAINRDPIPPAIFAIPAQCENMCQTTHLTYAERLQARADLELRKRAAAAAAAAD